MGTKTKAFDCVAFKDEMQRKAEERMKGLSAKERRARRLQDIDNGDMGEWWKRIHERSCSQEV